MKFSALFLLLISLAMPALAQEAPGGDNSSLQTVVREKGAPPPEARAFTGNVTQAPRKVGAERKRQPNVEIWLPPEFQSTEQKWPLIVFSHGFGGCAKQTAFLMQFLADHGYIVIAPDHADARCNRGLGNALVQSMGAGTRDWPEKPFRTPEAWTEETEADRRDDVLFAVSSMLDDRQYKNYVDTDKMGLIGHSLGGYTVLGLSGAWPSWKDKRFKAVLALSPYLTPYLKTGGIKKLRVPVMFQTGTADEDILPRLIGKGGAYAQSRAPKYLVELTGANHFAWTELDDRYEQIINKTALQFFDKYVKGGSIEILPDGADKPGKPTNKVKLFLKEEASAKN